jgi:phosphoglycolate phosphatase
MKDFYTYCIWDFNGTILDDVELGMNSVNTLLAERGIPTIPDKTAYRKRFDFPIIDYYKELGFNFDTDPYEELAELWVELYMRDLPTARLFPDVISTLDFFDGVGVKQSVISASERDMLTSQLKGLGIYGRFEEIMGIDNIYGDSKLDLARDWRRRHPDERVMFIGDTTHDCESAEILGADCFIVCAGHQCRERFDDGKYKIFDSLSDLVRYLKEI